MKVDHIVVAAPDLESAVADFARWTGTRPVDGGPHPGGGTRNALVSFGDGAYLEIIAPDPGQALAGTNGERFATLREPTLLHWAVQASGLEGAANAARQAGFVPRLIRNMARETPDGARLQWQLMGIGGHSLGGLVPFFIDWQGSPHPSDSAPLVGSLKILSLPDLPGLASLVAEIEGVELAPNADTPNADSMRVEFDSSAGVRGWKERAPLGFGF